MTDIVVLIGNKYDDDDDDAADAAVRRQLALPNNEYMARLVHRRLCK